MSGKQPTYEHQHLFSKNHRLYQQLLQEDIPAASSSSHPQAATIRFAKPSTIPIFITTNIPQQHSPEREEFSPRLPRSGGLFKGFQTRISNQATQSLSSNYCITENENQENSTVNLYSFSRNQIEPDLDLSRTPTTPRDPTDSRHTSAHNTHPSPATHNTPILEASLNPIQISDDRSQSQLCDNNDVLEPSQLSRASENIRKYRSEEYSQARQFEQEEEQNQHVPKVLAEKYLRSDITRKFSQESEKEAQQGSFRAVLNQIHVVPYRINNQLRPYAYSLPLQTRPKANSLHLHSSGLSLQVEEPTAARPLYFSNHTHAVVRPVQVAQSETHIRPAPRSEPKYSYAGERNRSNSIQCKSKPNISLQQEQRNPEHLEHSQVTKLFKNNTPIVVHDQHQESSIIYEAAGVNICCGLSQLQANKINFMPRPREAERQESPFFVSSIDMSRAVPLQPKAAYKINPIQFIRELNQPESQRSIKLVGFPRRPS